MDISIIIPTFNRAPVLATTLPTVFDQDFPSDAYEVIVVVDGSTDRTLEMLSGLKPSCGFRILKQTNQGQASARNAGLRAASGRLIVFLDDDVLSERNFLREHKAAHNGPEPCLVFGPILVSSESLGTLINAWLQGCADFFMTQASKKRGPWGLNDIRSNPLLLRRTIVRPRDTLFALRMRVHWGKTPWQDIRSQFTRTLGRLANGVASSAGGGPGNG